ncbi:DinB family protein [Flammeovirga agarivorans]|uniref:DinB family protein n=1 Tax=Flammeovirga agarivorans TaxID=2726742 RepID=A0A7X8SP32_9BACT|nr:DinB family protein [Flammeovirga agarivorans]NLR93801.1 DinB family protein [Flammeovirga agarivorans]
MSTVEIIKTQTEDAYNWVNKLVESIPHEQWDETPDIIDTNVTWQIGHLILSFNYHSLMSIRGPQLDLYQQLPIQEYFKLFVNTQPSECIGKTDAVALVEHLRLIQNRSIEIIANLSEDDLKAQLEPTKVPHPIAKNKFQALDWNVKHTMWHCGQLGLLKKVLGQRYDFGLKV